jgi:hypothetical protein
MLAPQRRHSVSGSRVRLEPRCQNTINSNSKAEGRFDKQDFRYGEEDVYVRERPLQPPSLRAHLSALMRKAICVRHRLFVQRVAISKNEAPSIAIVGTSRRRAPMRCEECQRTAAPSHQAPQHSLRSCRCRVDQNPETARRSADAGQSVDPFLERTRRIAAVERDLRHQRV